MAGRSKSICVHGRGESVQGLGKKPKYGNTRFNGYDSKREWQRAVQLRALEKAGQISDLREQVRFELIPAQKRLGKVVERACHYVADFVYVRAGERVVEDAKGHRTRHYIDKRKWMLWVHGIQIAET